MVIMIINENMVIILLREEKDHELVIDPELVRALSPAQSPFNSPIHMLGPSGLRTPPNPRKRNRDSGYSSGLPASPAMLHKESVSSELKHPQQVKEALER